MGVWSLMSKIKYTIKITDREEQNRKWKHPRCGNKKLTIQMNRATKLREGGGEVSEGHEDENGEEWRRSGERRD